ncbi:unnamed protein product [Peniophora sp. CBMAI 1063]|nr:unnamed protein product [Peniophora sp. CBMAI 1063]
MIVKMFSALPLVFVALAASTAFAAPAEESVRRQDAGQPITGGFATYYFPSGVAGPCGQGFPDSAFIVAEQAQRWKVSDCARQVRVTNNNNGKSVVAIVEDRCPGCQGNANSLDLSVGAFTAIADESEGIVPITWEYI